MSIVKLSKILVSVALIGFLVMLILTHIFLFQRFSALALLEQMVIVFGMISVDSIITWALIDGFTDYKKGKSD